MKVTVSIVTYNSENVISNCLNSIIEKTRDIEFEIIVVDNNSEDNTVNIIENNFPHINLIKNKNNVGFGKAHNQAFKIAKGENLLILNPDTLLLNNAIKKTSEFLDNTKDAGLVGCKIWWDDEKTFMFPDLPLHNLKTALLYFTPLCRYFPDNPLAKSHWKSAYKTWNATKPIKVKGITGGFMMVRSEIFRKIGGFDENFFLFFEEHDLQRRIKKLGWNIYYFPDAEIQHYFEESCRNSSIDITKIFDQSAFYYYNKYYWIFGKTFITLIKKTSNFFSFKQNYLSICPQNNKIHIKWEKINNATKYLVEISYKSDFCDRGGMYVINQQTTIKSDIIKKLPHGIGFIKISPVYEGNKHGKSIVIYKISNHETFHRHSIKRST